ncbi:MAG: 3-deoxy-manno-octulosonate cytidylyltransferase [Bacteroidales bacterium]|jgi:3-deoxy-manno-octulosonate cytidylyltransferase (CMP-KDO synthetase)|nr:3-deoxy-manno-octulosonate cytidylyltransferase [Bacteroidales bacterium]
MKILALIPSRFASSRFPGKPLAIVNGKPMIRRVYEQSTKAFETVYVATDDSRIYDAVESFGGKAVMTSVEHRNGTDRCCEALHKIEKETRRKFDTIINIQGDEPYIRPEQLIQLAGCFEDPAVKLATLVKRVLDKKELFNQNNPKVVLDKDMNAIYFSRTPIPFPRGKEIDDDYIKRTPFYRHIGLYGYKADTLPEICNLKQSFLEETEKLEQLRWIENGYKIRTSITDYETHAVDTPEDLKFLNDTELFK